MVRPSLLFVGYLTLVIVCVDFHSVRAKSPVILNSELKLHEFFVPAEEKLDRISFMAAVWIVDFDQPLYFKKKLWVDYDGEANDILGLTRLSCLNGHVLIDSHPRHGQKNVVNFGPEKKLPEFLIPLGKRLVFRNKMVRHMVETLRNTESGGLKPNRFSTFLIFENNAVNHHGRYCHSGICSDELETCTLHFLAKEIQDWLPHALLTGPTQLEVDAVRTQTQAHTIPTDSARASVAEYRPEKEYYDHKYIPGLPDLVSHVVYGDDEENKRRQEDEAKNARSGLEKGTMFPSTWFSRPSIYSMLQILEKGKTMARLDDQTKDGFREIVDSQIILWSTTLIQPKYEKTLAVTQEATRMSTLLGPMEKAIDPGAPIMGRRRRLLSEMFETKQKSFTRRIVSVEDVPTAEARNILLKYFHSVEELAYTARERLTKKLHASLLELGLDINPNKAKKWRWQKNDPEVNQPEPKVKLSETLPLPSIPISKKKKWDPCLEPHSPASVAACIKHASGPDLKDKNIEDAYVAAYRNALNAELMEQGKDPMPVNATLPKKDSSQEKSPLIVKLETSIRDIRKAKEIHELSEDASDKSIAVLKRLENEVGLLGQAEDERLGGAGSLLEIGERTHGRVSASCDESRSRSSCEKAREIYGANPGNSIYKDACVWCYRIEGGATQGRCVSQEHSTKKEMQHYKCTSFEPLGFENKPDESKQVADTTPIQEAASNDNPAGGGSVTLSSYTDGAVANTMMELMDTMHARTIDGLRKSINDTVFRSTNMMVTEQLTGSLVESLTENVASMLSRTVLRVGNKKIAAKSVPALTHIVTASLGQALTRSPKNDYYCHYCKEFKYYCDFCFRSSVEDYQKDYYSSYYAEYYSQYYTFYYEGPLGEGFAGEIINPQQT